MREADSFGSRESTSGLRGTASTDTMTDSAVAVRLTAVGCPQFNGQLIHDITAIEITVRLEFASALAGERSPHFLRAWVSDQSAHHLVVSSTSGTTSRGMLSGKHARNRVSRE